MILPVTEPQARQRLLQLVQQVKAELHLQRPPSYEGVDDPIARHLGIIVKEADLEFDEGQYIPQHPPAVPVPMIVLDPRAADQDRLNFTFFHEMAHHLILRDDPLQSFLHEHTPTSEQHETALNRLCDVAAAEFLIPREDVRETILERGFSMTLIEYLEPRYPASKPAIAIQLAQCCSHRCFVTICGTCQLHQPSRAQMVLPTNRAISNEQLGVLYSWSSQSLGKYSIARYSPIPRNHVIAASFNGRQLVRGLARIPFRSGTNWKCDCEAFYYKGRVYAAFNVTAPTPRNQLRLL